MRLIYLAIGLIIAAANSPGLAVAQDYSTAVRSELRACYETANAPEDKYGCMGNSTKTCLDQTGLTPDESVVLCATAEVSAWRELLDEETTFVAELIRASEMSEDPCEPSIDECIDQLEQMTAWAEEEMKRKCGFESLPENNAGYPEMANTLCQLREIARNTVRMALLRERVTQ